MKKLFILLLTALFLTTAVWADDSFFSSSFDDTESTENSGFGDSSFGDAFGDSASGEESPTVEINGGVSATVRAYVSEDAVDAMGDLDNSSDQMKTETEANLKFTYEGTDFRIVTDLDFVPEQSGSEADTSVSINEAFGQYFADSFNFEAGYMKVAWGKADEFHVVDVLNNINMGDFLIPDYMEMIDPELMFKVNVPLGMSGMLEMAYVPTLTPDTIPEKGIWEQKDTKVELPATLTALSTAYSATASPLYSEAINTETFDYGQAAFHYTSTAAGFDYGLTYYYGYNKLPSFNYAFDGSKINYWFEYDKMQTFGLEASYILAGLNLKGEFAYNLTEDYDGTDTSVHNNNIRWVGGFDRDIPLSNLNINIQEAGTLILNNDEIALGDIEYDDEEEYTQNLLILAVKDTYLHEKLEAEVIIFYHFEDADYGIYPSLDYSPVDDFTLGMEARFFGGDKDSLFGQFDDNDFVEFSVSYNF